MVHLQNGDLSECFQVRGITNAHQPAYEMDPVGKMVMKMVMKVTGTLSAFVKCCLLDSTSANGLTTPLHQPLGVHSTTVPVLKSRKWKFGKTDASFLKSCA